MEFRKNVDRIAAIKRDLDAKQERAEEISAREILLEMPQSDFLTRLEDTRAQVEPLDRLWNTVKVRVWGLEDESMKGREINREREREIRLEERKK